MTDNLRILTGSPEAVQQQAQEYLNGHPKARILSTSITVLALALATELISRVEGVADPEEGKLVEQTADGKATTQTAQTDKAHTDNKSKDTQAKDKVTPQPVLPDGPVKGSDPLPGITGTAPEREIVVCMVLGHQF